MSHTSSEDLRVTVVSQPGLNDSEVSSEEENYARKEGPHEANLESTKADKQ